MLTLLFFICFFAIFGKILRFGLKAAWGMTKFVLFVVFLPLILVGLVFDGLLSIAFPILLVVGLLSLFQTTTA